MSEYRVIVESNDGSLSTDIHFDIMGFNHFCSASDLCNVEVTHFKANERWGTREAVNWGDLPKWFKNKVIKTFLRKLQQRGHITSFIRTDYTHSTRTGYLNAGQFIKEGCGDFIHNQTVLFNEGEEGEMSIVSFDTHDLNLDDIGDCEDPVAKKDIGEITEAVVREYMERL